MTTERRYSFSVKEQEDQRKLVLTRLPVCLQQERMLNQSGGNSRARDVFGLRCLPGKAAFTWHAQHMCGVLTVTTSRVYGEEMQNQETKSDPRMQKNLIWPGRRGAVETETTRRRETSRNMNSSLWWSCLPFQWRRGYDIPSYTMSGPEDRTPSRGTPIFIHCSVLYYRLLCTSVLDLWQELFDLTRFFFSDLCGVCCEIINIVTIKQVVIEEMRNANEWCRNHSACMLAGWKMRNKWWLKTTQTGGQSMWFRLCF